uniref:cell envelope integrity protein TolA n=1 Tax=Scandinavium goeteborgense TaxID=1851514 RepID=UPI001CA5E6CB|nr:cell envelope integrity protein TolA [Scandinavium goeteborgense]
MMKKIIKAGAILTLLSVNGCVTHKPTQTPLEQQNSVDNLSDVEPIPRYAQQIKSAIEARLYDESIYAGKSCRLKLRLASNGQVMSAIAEGGNPNLCAAALAAIKQANIPAAPDDDTYMVFKNSVLDFKL